jgi:hypothetical protein
MRLPLGRRFIAAWFPRHSGSFFGFSGLSDLGNRFGRNAAGDYRRVARADYAQEIAR